MSRLLYGSSVQADTVSTNRKSPKNLKIVFVIRRVGQGLIFNFCQAAELPPSCDSLVFVSVVLVEYFAMQEFFVGGFGSLYPKFADLLFGFIDHLTCRFPGFNQCSVSGQSIRHYS